MNIVEGIQEQTKRVQSAIATVEEMKLPNVSFWLAVARNAIAEGEKAIASGDVVRMIGAYQELESIKE